MLKESKCKVRKLTDGAKREGRGNANKDNEIKKEKAKRIETWEKNL